jgi:sterol desaturase/sphingolipid hydroxylase (fatty acid hydroxylase superfamily)
VTVTGSAWLVSTGVVIVAVWAETMVEVVRVDRWRVRVRDLGAGSALAVASLPASAVASVVAYQAWPVLGRVTPEPVAAATGHPVIGFVIAFVVWDGLGWVDHWIGHRTRVGWFTHRPHHGGGFDLTVALRQSPFPLAGIALLPTVASTGVSFETMAVVLAVSNTWQALIHTQADLPGLRWCESAVMTPATHRVHHDDGGLVNLGPVLTVWDRAAGTFRVPAPRSESRGSAHRRLRFSSR